MTSKQASAGGEMEVVGCTENSVNLHQTIQRHMLEDSTVCSHRHETIGSQKSYIILCYCVKYGICNVA
jgi:hypothetical protein